MHPPKRASMFSTVTWGYVFRFCENPYRRKATTGGPASCAWLGVEVLSLKDRAATGRVLRYPSDIRKTHIRIKNVGDGSHLCVSRRAEYLG